MDELNADMSSLGSRAVGGCHSRIENKLDLNSNLWYTPCRMKTLRNILMIFGAILTVLGITLFLIGYLKPQPAGILVDTSPTSDVFIDDILAGKTPFQETHQSGQITLKLVPLITDQNLLPFETKINLTSGIQTVVRREFGDTEDDSSGDIISFDPDSGQGASLVVVSTPDNAQVSLDGIPRGFAPFKTDTISPATHQITVRAPGYSDRVMTVNTKQGFRLNLFAKLAKIKEAPLPAATPKSPTQTVTILTTPTGYLNVHTKPGAGTNNIGQVKPGDKFPYLGSDQTTGWYEIQFEASAAGLPNGITGWITNQYATISATPSI